jgi:hypothetical protein
LRQAVSFVFDAPTDQPSRQRREQNAHSLHPTIECGEISRTDPVKQESR